MKKLYSSMLAFALCTFGASAAGLEVTFNGSDNAKWNAGNVAVVADGHLTVEMPLSGTKYRQDISFNDKSNAYHFTAEDKIVAVKFIGDRPATCKMTFEIQRIAQDGESGDKWLNTLWQSNKVDGRIETTGGNTIYYYDLTRHENYREEMDMSRVNIKMADATDANDRTYVIDWIKSYPSVEALEADKDWKDDGVADEDEGTVKLMPVVNATTGVGYSNLTDAWNAVQTGETLLVSEDQTITSRLGANGKEITIKGLNGAKLIRGAKFGNSLMFLANTNGNHKLHFEDLIIDGANVKSSKAVVEASQSARVTFKNVVLINNTITDSKVIDVKNNGVATFENVKIENSSLPENGTDLFVGSHDRITLIGDNSFSIKVEKTYQIKSENLTNATPLPIYIDDNRDVITLNKNIVTNCTEPERFDLRTVDFAIESEGSNLVLVPVEPKAVVFDRELTGEKVDMFTVSASVGSTIYMQVIPEGAQASFFAVVSESDDVDVTDGTWEKNADATTPHIMAVNVNDILNNRGPATLKFVAMKNGKISPVSTVAVSNSGTTGIEGVADEAEDAVVEWYNLQGMRVENPANGIFIRRQGNRVEKVVVK